MILPRLNRNQSFIVARKIIAIAHSTRRHRPPALPPHPVYIRCPSAPGMVCRARDSSLRAGHPTEMLAILANRVVESR